MPKDQWRRANNRARYGETRYRHDNGADHIFASQILEEKRCKSPIRSKDRGRDHHLYFTISVGTPCWVRRVAAKGNNWIEYKTTRILQFKCPNGPHNKLVPTFTFQSGDWLLRVTKLFVTRKPKSVSTPTHDRKGVRHTQDLSSSGKPLDFLTDEVRQSAADAVPHGTSGSGSPSETPEVCV